MSWPTGLTWTKGKFEETTVLLTERKLNLEPPYPATFKQHNGRSIMVTEMYVHGGPFLWVKIPLINKRIYIGFRPTSVWPPGFGNEGTFGSLARWLKYHDWGNFGVGIRSVK